MMNRNTYIDQLLSELKTLEESLQEIKTSDSMPFSFFKESFSKTQEISRLLHKLEFLQVDEMKNQMEKLVYFLSESEKKSKNQENELQLARMKVRELEEQRKKEQIKGLENQRELENQRDLGNPSIEDQPSPESEKEIPGTMDVKANEQVAKTYLEGFVLPEYKNPNRDKATPSPIVSPTLPPEYHSPRIIDLKKGVSINDRFLFQRELFNNSSQLMNSTIDELNRMESYEEAETYIRENFTWDFESPTINDFLTIVRKRFK